MAAAGYPQHADSRVEGFRRSTPPGAADYEALFQYFIAGFLRYRSPGGARASYPGLGSKHGAAVDSLEGFSRSAPLWAAWLAGGRPAVIQLESGSHIDLRQLLRTGLLNGTDPGSTEYWGVMRHKDQRIVEAADLALVLWLTRESIWTDLQPRQREQIANWLRQTERLETWDNNWHLFPVLVSAVLQALGEPTDSEGARRRYEAFKRLHLGGGWFSDGKVPQVDYYNAWGMHYPLLWLSRIDPEWDREFLPTATEEFLSTYRYLMGPEGYPVMGRSVCYRTAVPAPLVLAQLAGSAAVTPGEARRALDTNWSYFIRRGSLRDGNLTQSYCAGADARTLDKYSGAASCLWGLRSLVAAFALPPQHRFWTEPAEPLPVEQGDYVVKIPPAGWTLIGHQDSATIEIHRAGRAERIPLRPVTWLMRMAGWVLRRPVRPHNHAAKYEASVYSSKSPFCGCAGD